MRRFAKTALGVGLALGMVVAMATTGPAVAAPPPDVATVVTAKVLDRARDLAGFRTADAADTEIRVNRTQGRWAFGTAVLRAPTEEHAAPRDWLFLAELRNGRWRVAFDGEPEFGILATAAPVLSTRERSILASHDGQSVSTAANGDYRTQMRLPWAIGQSWSLLGGPHAWDAGSGPWSSLDLAGGDQRVLAARAGLAYTTCTGRILVYHEDGYTTRYYHLWDHIWVDGQWVDEGGFLGYTGIEVGCGGAAGSRHDTSSTRSARSGTAETPANPKRSRRRTEARSSLRRRTASGRSRSPRSLPACTGIRADWRDRSRSPRCVISVPITSFQRRCFSCSTPRPISSSFSHRSGRSMSRKEI